MDGVLMLNRVRDFGRVLLLVPMAWMVASCEITGQAPISEDAAPPIEDAGSDLGPCGKDCSKIETAQCLIGVCNDKGEFPGPENGCVIVPAPKGTGCDDGKFCTVADACDEGVCGGGTTNRCGIKPDPCSSISCFEELEMCDTSPVSDGVACTPTDPCKINGVCQTGQCMGEKRDCSFSPLHECNTVECDSATGKCVGAPDPTKDNVPCVLTGDLCKVEKVCQVGQCVGGVPKDCTALNIGCQVGACEAMSGICGPKPASIGTACTSGTAECQVGACDVKGECLSSSAPDGTACNDYNSCTKLEKCTAGACVGSSPVSGCVTYLHASFETCSNGWTFGGDWECGTPTNVGPTTAHIGTGVIATQIAGVYHVNQSFTSTFADSPPINLAMATTPVASFWAWVHTEVSSYDGWNLKISTDGGQSFATVTTVTPAYNLMVAMQPAWGGNHSAKGWENYTADLTAYAGQSVILRYAFKSDGAGVFPGVYVDELVVAEPPQIPLYITTESPLPDVYTGMSYAVDITKIGGSSNTVWSIKMGGLNSGWLNIDSMTGKLKGTPSAANVGLVSFTVHAEEPSLPSNFAERTFSFNVKANSYYTSFEDTCPNGWTLTGDWQCGVPVPYPLSTMPMTLLGPANAYLGTQCIATQIAGPYSNLQTFAGATATSPDIDLTNAQAPILTFRMWIDTEGGQYDGVNLQVTTDNGMNYSLVNGVLPAYPLMVAGKPAWGGHQGAFGWQLMQADLSQYAGQIIRLRFAFQSDASGQNPGAYIDDIFVK
jgi:hypothetical protein